MRLECLQAFQEVLLVLKSVMLWHSLYHAANSRSPAHAAERY